MKLASNIAYADGALPEVMQITVPEREYPQKRRRDCFSGSSTRRN